MSVILCEISQMWVGYIWVIANILASDVIELLNEIDSNHAQKSNNTQSMYIKFESDLIWSSSFLLPSTENSLDLYDEADDFTYAYANSDDDLFSEAKKHS